MRKYVAPMGGPCGKQEQVGAGGGGDTFNLPSKRPPFGDNDSVCSEVFVDTQEPGLDRGRGPWAAWAASRLSGSSNTFTTVNTNLYNGNMLRDENSRDASLDDPNSQ